VDKEELRKIEEETDTTRELITKLKEKSANLQNELKFYNSTLTNEELANKIEVVKIEVESLVNNLSSWKEGKIQKIPDDIISDGEHNYDKAKNTYKKTKKICLTILDSFCEGMEMKRDELTKFLSGYEYENEVFQTLNTKNL